MSEVTGINRHQWRYVANASKDDFMMLVAAQEWKVLDNLAAKVQHFKDALFATNQGQEDFLDLYNYMVEYIEANGQLPAVCSTLILGKVALGGVTD